MAEEPEDLAPEAEGEDPTPAPSRSRARRSSKSSSGRGRKEGPTATEAAADVAGDVTQPERKSRRTTSEARRGGEAVWGLFGTGVQVAGQYSSTPGAVAAGWVMQAQAKDGGRVLAQRLLETRWYPYLEKLGRGGSIGGVFAAPLCAFFYVQLPGARPLLTPILGNMIGKLTVEVPDQQTGEVMQVNVWGAIQAESAAQYERDQQAAAEAAAAAAVAGNGDVPPHYEPPPVPPVDEVPGEPGVEHVRSVYNDLGGPPAPEI